MASLFSDMMANLKQATNTTLKDNESSNAVQFMNSSINQIKSILKTLDRILKKKNIDVGAMADKGVAKGKGLIAKGRALISETKEKGFIATAKEKAEGVKSKLTNLFKDSNETGTSPPEEEKEEEKKSSKPKWVDKILNSLKKLEKDKGDEDKPKKTSWIDKALGRSDARKAEVEEEKKSVQERAKKPKGGGWLNKVLGGILSLGGMLLGGFKKIIGWGTGFLFKGISKALFSLVPSLSGGIARATASLVGGGIKGAAGLAWAGIKAVAGSGMVKGAAMAVGRGALMLATGPVGWAVAIGTAAYAGYRLYKYLKRNDVADDLPGKLTRLRLLMYGFDDTNKEYYSKIFDLEMMMKEKIKFQDYKVTVDKLDKDTIEKILDIFSVAREDKQKYAILNTWFIKRFMPAFKAYVQSLYSVNSSIFVDALEKLKPVDMVNFVTKMNIPSVIYDIKQIPTKDDSSTNVTKETVDALLVNIINDAKSKVTDAGSKEAAKKIEEENKNKKAAVNSQQASANTKPKEADKPVENKPKETSSKNMNPSGGVDGEVKPPEASPTGGGNDLNSKVSNKINKTSGEMVPGTQSLDGIKTKLDKEKIFNLDPNVRELFTGMAKEYHTLTGKSLQVNEAFRTYDDQAALYKAHPDKAAKPGGSTHEHGLAIDINSVDANELDKMGLMRKYGFTRPVGGEKWHLEPIGVSLNPNLAKKDQEYRHKAILASPGKGGDGYGASDKSIKKKRNMDYQLAIYNKNGENVIDPEKAMSKAKDGQPPNLEPSSTKPDVKPTISSAPQIGKDTKSPIKEESTAPKPAAVSSSGPSLNEPPKSTVSDNSNIDISKFADLKGEQAIRQAAKATGMNEQTMLAYAKMESSGKGGAMKNKNSTAIGMFQILRDTWKDLVARHGSKYGMPSDAKPDNDYYNSLMAMEYAKENLAGLPDYKAAGIDEATAIYLAHHYGPSGARKIIDFLKKSPNAPMKDAVSSSAYKSNTEAIGSNTVSEYVQKVSNKINSGTGVESKSTVGKSDPSVTTAMGKPNQSNSEDKTTPTVQVTTPINKPSISTTQSYSSNQSPYKAIETKPAEVAAPQPQQQPGLNKNVESLMSDQLSTLTQIATILKSIDSKFDIDKFKGAMTGKPQSPPPSIDKSIPKDSVNLSAKKIQA